MPAMLAQRLWQPGTYLFPVGGQFADGVALPAGINYVKLTLDVTEMVDPAVTVAFDAEVSFDDGLTWHHNRVSFQGGPIRMTDAAGQPRTPPFVSSHEFHVARSDLSTRRVRVSITISGLSIRLQSDLELL